MFSRSILSFLVLFIASVGICNGQSSNSSLTINISGAISQTASFSNVDYGRIVNPNYNAFLPTESTLSLFSVPPSPNSGELEVAIILANAVPVPPGIQPGTYQMVPVQNEYPVLMQFPKLGFITVVKTKNGIPEEEYFTESGSVNLITANSGVVEGTFQAVLRTSNGQKEISVNGSFRKSL
ncbi:hypothetical protein [Algoriphagus sp. AK58]|uniref:hypothetical protein n=1 Tax=Algoriphagus sp. AK58 TaxID=1406877 RepID=UPI001650CE52|nr:hypothetical protein [Algoriphagus sp. AK58]MBC6367806.1 hypothetical protein [Algoriphagus sp. AK58]